jgi:hypothetical protein
LSGAGDIAIHPVIEPDHVRECADRFAPQKRDRNSTESHSPNSRSMDGAIRMNGLEDCGRDRVSLPPPVGRLNETPAGLSGG